MITQSTLNKALIQTTIDWDINSLKVMLYLGADVNTQDEDGWTAAHWASHYAQIKILNTLLEQPLLDLTIKNKRGQTAYDLAPTEKIKKLLSTY